MGTINLENKNYFGETIALFKRWLENRNANKTFADFFAEYGCKSIAIMDAGEIGRLLYEEVKDADIEIKYFIDRNAEALDNIDGIPVVQMKDIGKMPQVDIIAVSTIFNYSEAAKLFASINPEIRSISMKDAAYEF